jgi:predicted DNA binding CopG/RHH family protein
MTITKNHVLDIDINQELAEPIEFIDPESHDDLQNTKDSRITMRIPQNIREELEQIAEEEGRPLTNFLRNELIKMLERKKKN